MLLKSAHVQACMKRLRFDPKALEAKLQAEGRAKQSTAAQRENLKANLLQTSASPEQAKLAFERIIGGNDLMPIAYLNRGVRCAEPVCRIQLRDASRRVVGYATGFLIAPNVLMTNHHVFGVASEAADSLAEFDYETDTEGNDRPVSRFAFEPSKLFYACQPLDFAIVAVAEVSDDGQRQLKDFGWLTLDPTPGKSVVGEYLTIIQHPGGERKQVCVRENQLLKFEESTLWYATDTVAGSSGSPVFNQLWQVVALHHCGVPKTDKAGHWLTNDGRVWQTGMDESDVAWLANEGVRISAIHSQLRQALPDHALLMPVFKGQDASPPERRDAPPAASGSSPEGAVSADGSVSLTIPLKLTFQLGGLGQMATRSRNDAETPRRTAATALKPIAALPSAGDDSVIEKVEINTKTYSQRPGYQEDFLGAGAALRVPLPKLSPALAKIAARLKKPEGANAEAYTLKYWNYSVVMNAERKLAFFSAVNIDGKQRRDVGKREGDSWIKDSRIAAEHQVGQEFYSHQLTTEASRAKNPFDRGHLVRRLDGTWGLTESAAKEHGDDTFHFTNCSPQHYIFNQGKPLDAGDPAARKKGKTLWAAIEDYVLFHVENEKSKACVINGPVFSAKDPKSGGILVPLQFYKIAVFAKGGKLSASAFLLSQANLLAPFLGKRDEEAVSNVPDAYAEIFQVPVAHVADLTKLDFGPLIKASTKVAKPNESLEETVRLIESVDDIEL